MSSQLPIDCLIKILECLEEDKVALHSCLLVNRLWCKISVKILWREIGIFKHKMNKISDRSLKILRILITCLPNESKDLLFKKGVSTSTSKSPLFDYALFCKAISIPHLMIDDYSYKKRFSETIIDCYRNCYRTYFITQEILKSFMKQTSLKQLVF